MKKSISEKKNYAAKKDYIKTAERKLSISQPESNNKVQSLKKTVTK